MLPITHEYMPTYHSNESQKYDQFLCRITYLLLLPHVLLLRPNCDPPSPAHTPTIRHVPPSLREAAAISLQPTVNRGRALDLFRMGREEHILYRKTFSCEYILEKKTKTK